MWHKAMISEINVIHLVKASGQVRRLVADLLGPWASAERLALLRCLRKHKTIEELAIEFFCSKQEVFNKLHNYVQRDFERKPLPLLTFEHLHVLAVGQYEFRLARILNCNPERICENLFNADVILRILLEFDPEWTRQQFITAFERGSTLPYMGVVFTKLLAFKEKIETQYRINEFEWERLMDEQQWLSGYALQCLSEYASKQGFAPERNSRLLAAALGKDDIQRQQLHDAYLDALGILEIKRRVDWIVRQLREQVQELVVPSLLEIPRIADIPMDCLQAYVEFYELRAPATAWRTILTATETKIPTLRETLAGLDIRSTGTEGTPEATAHLQVRIEKAWLERARAPFKRKKRAIDNSLIVSCKIKENKMTPADILVCHNVTPTKVKTLTSLFASLRGRDIADEHLSDIGQRLLERRLASSQTFEVSLKKACEQLLPEIIRSLILSGVPFPSELDMMWKNRLSSTPPISPLTCGKDTTFPKNRGEMLKWVQQEYAQHANVKIIT